LLCNSAFRGWLYLLWGLLVLSKLANPIIAIPTMNILMGSEKVCEGKLLTGKLFALMQNNIVKAKPRAGKTYRRTILIIISLSYNQKYFLSFNQFQASKMPDLPTAGLFFLDVFSAN
jgi:hypothetical protein